MHCRLALAIKVKFEHFVFASVGDMETVAVLHGGSVCVLVSFSFGRQMGFCLLSILGDRGEGWAGLFVDRSKKYNTRQNN